MYKGQRRQLANIPTMTYDKLSTFTRRAKCLLAHLFQTIHSFSFRGHSQLGQGWCYHGNKTGENRTKKNKKEKKTILSSRDDMIMTS